MAMLISTVLSMIKCELANHIDVDDVNLTLIENSLTFNTYSASYIIRVEQEGKPKKEAIMTATYKEYVGCRDESAFAQLIRAKVEQAVKELTA